MIMEKDNMLEAQTSLLREEEYASNVPKERKPSSSRSHFTTLNIAILVLNLLGVLVNLILPSLERSKPACKSERNLIYCVFKALLRTIDL